MPIVAPSILACDWGRFNEEIASVEKAGADWIHIDVMDGQFVPPITFGPGVVKAARQAAKIPLDVHLMIESPENQIQAFADAGADYITVHVETCPHLHRTLQQIREAGARPGVSINPATPVASIEPVIDQVDLILIMSVNPGWGGQKFIESSIGRIQQTAELAAKSGSSAEIEVDGGINAETGPRVVNAGATALVAGTHVFGSKSYADAISALKD